MTHVATPFARRRPAAGRHRSWAAMILLGVMLMSTPAAAASPFTPEEAKALLFHGPTTTVDAGFPYYQGRSVESIAEEIALRGYRAVHLVITSEKNVNRALIDAFHAQGIAVWGMVWAGGTYSTAGFPPEWPEWRQQLITPAAPDGFIYLSPYHPGYRAWKKAALRELVQNYPIDGIELVEAFFPNWNGLQTGVYGDIGPYAQEAYRQRYGEEPPNFTDPSHPRYYTKVPDVYQRWIQFRVDTVTEWLNDLVNGPGGIREARPGIPVATWTLATDWPNSMAKARVDVGEDLAAVITAVRPDLHFLQTNWPDWIKANLSPDYIRRYAPYLETLRAAAPDLPVGIQADIGSQPQNRRDWDWIRALERTAWEMGFSTSTLYEYHIGMYMYTEPPRIVRAVRPAADTVVLSFNKRIDWRSTRDVSQFTVLAADGSGAHPDVRVARALVDGNRLTLTLEGSAAALQGPLELHVRGVTDLPAVYLLKNYPALTMEPQQVSVPAPPAP